MNVSTLKLIATSLERWNSREALKLAKTRLYCVTDPSHGVQPVIDFRPMVKFAVLGCDCTRPVTMMTDQERNEFDAAQQATKKKRLLKTSPTLQVFEEDIEAEAA